MTRARKQTYRSQELGELARQLLYAPPTKRAEVVRHAELLHDELDTAKNYPIDFVVYRLTDRRVPPSESVMLVGEAIKPDLRLVIDALSQSIELPPDADDPGETTTELAKRLGVSTKTIARWRDNGLRWRWGVREVHDKPKHTVLITRAALAAFEKDNAGRVSAAAAFSRLSKTERARLIARARRLAQTTDAKPKAILSHLAKRSGRSQEALRQLISHHDQQHPANPEQAVFTDRTGPLTAEQKQAIHESYGNGSTVSGLCQRFGKTRSTIYRAIHEGRAKRVAQMQIAYVPSPIFNRDDADEVLMQPLTQQDKGRSLGADIIASLPGSIRLIYDRPIAPDRFIRSLIVRYNYLKHRARLVQATLETQGVRANELDQFDELWLRAQQTRGELIDGLLPVVLSVVRRQLAGEASSSQRLLAMLDRGNAVLIEEIELFDPARSHKLESVLTNRLLRVLTQEIASIHIDAAALQKRLEDAGWRGASPRGDG